MKKVLVTKNILEIEPLLELVASDRAGAEIFMIGKIRNHADGEEVIGLHYECYLEMAEKKILQIVEKVEKEIPESICAAHHRIGTLQINDRAVIVAASHPHRKQAFAACSLIIDRLKESVPIWKHEKRESGKIWVGFGP